MAPQTPSPRRRSSPGEVRRRRPRLAALLGAICCGWLSGCGPTEIEYIHVTEGSGFVATSKVEYQPEAAGTPEQPPSVLATGQPEPSSTLTPPAMLEPAPAAPSVLSELAITGPSMESGLPMLPEGALPPEQTQPEQFHPEAVEPRVVPLRTSVKPTPDPTPAEDRLEARGQEWLGDLLLAYRSQARPDVGLNNNELRELNAPSQPQPELNSAAQRAERRVAAGSRLVERGATHSGREEFIGALQIIAEALDQQRRTNAHSRALSAGLTALEEARDFVSSTPQQRLPLSELVRGHQTPALHDLSLEQLSNQDALQSYMNYAQQQLSTAGGDLLPGADALFALGKLHLLQSQQPGAAPPRLELERSIMLFNAALVIEPKHSLAANEVGVALARLGRMEDAKRALQHSASLTAHPSTWRNLATVHQTLGEGQLAQLAERESQTANNRWQAQAQATGQLAHGTVQVVDNPTFAQAAPVNTFDNAAGRANAPVAGNATPGDNGVAPQQPGPTPNAPQNAGGQPTLADPQVRSAPQQPWGQANPPRGPSPARTATPPQYGTGTFR